jgi:hypothetical protein
MSITIGIYDFFSRIIPGGVFVAALLYILQKDSSLAINLANVSTLQFVILGTLSYIFGFILTPVSEPWYRFFRPKNLYKKTIDDLGKELPTVEMNLQDMDWYTLLAFIKRHSMQMAQDVEQLNAVSIMLRNTGFSFVCFALIFAAEILFGNHVLRNIFLSIFCLLASVVLAHEAVKFRTWFYRAVYQSVVALIAEPKQLSVKFLTKPPST